jgi:hypothetical protein
MEVENFIYSQVNMEWHSWPNAVPKHTKEHFSPTTNYPIFLKLNISVLYSGGLQVQMSV